jgi:hypothetical protein
MTEPASSQHAELIDRVDRLTQILEVALAPQIEAGRALLRPNEVDAAIFDHTAGTWIATANLQKRVTKATGAKTRSIQNHLSSLVERGFVRKRGGGRSIEFRSVGVI